MESVEPSSITPVKKSLITFERFGRFATVIGFIVDTMTLATSIIAIASILLFTSNGNNPTLVFSNIKLTPYHALMIWALGVYSYIGVLHVYWTKNIAEFSATFGAFLWKDLIRGFKKPFRLMPLAVSMLCLIWILVEADMLAPVLTGIFAIILICGFLYAIAHAETPATTREKFLKNLDDDWLNWDKRIQTELSGNQFISCYNFKDVTELWGLNYTDIQPMLAKYASKHPKTTKYTTIWEREENELSKEPVCRNALVSVKNLDRERFFI